MPMIQLRVGAADVAGYGPGHVQLGADLVLARSQLPAGHVTGGNGGAHVGDVLADVMTVQLGDDHLVLLRVGLRQRLTDDTRRQDGGYQHCFEHWTFLVSHRLPAAEGLRHEPPMRTGVGVRRAGA